jgi:2-keto-3-deoxy-6-phosphogluconate aldolase
VGPVIAAGVFALGIGGELVDAAVLRAGNPAKITPWARELVQAVQAARKAVSKRAGPLQ